MDFEVVYPRWDAPIRMGDRVAAKQSILVSSMYSDSRPIVMTVVDIDPERKTVTVAWQARTNVFEARMRISDLVVVVVE